MSFANDILDAIEIMVKQVVEDNATKIYTGVCKTIGVNNCVLTINGKDNTVKYYGGVPVVGTVYQVFIPFGNMSAAFIIVPGSGGGSGGGSGVDSVNGKTGDVVLTATDVGAAPAGFGLGESSTYDNLIADCNQATKNGWYWTYENVQNAPMDYGFLHVCCNGAYIKQEWWVTGTMGVLMAIRVCNGGTWMPWEWVNPLMLLGVEYRTTERYLGKPVYTRLFNCGNMPAAGTMSTVQAPYNEDTNPISNAWIYNAFLTYYGQSLPRYTYGSTIGVSSGVCVNSSGLISIVTNGSTDLTNSNANLYVTLKYTKNTD